MPDSVELFVDGTSIAQMPAQFFYRAFWHSASFPEGVHTLVAKATLQGVTRQSAGVLVVVDRTPPQSSFVQPNANVEVDQNTTFTVDFDEPVNGLPFGLANAVQLTVVPVGQAQPVVIPADVQLDSAGQHLTVQATAPLPIGVAGLSWGGLQDAAGNAITGTVAATWNVRRFAQVGDGIRFSGPSMGAVIDANGVPFLVRRRQADTNLEVITLSSGVFVPLGPVINDRPASGDASIAVKGGQVWVAFSQDDAAGTGADVRVRRLDAATNTWQTPGNQTFAVQRAGTGNGIHPRISLDAQGLPTLVFIGSTGGQFDLQGFRFDGTNWVPLG
ncbi:MAG TPA: Ig-like domain-containing protein, partial [Mycobacteriales bacterium]|nr:Ig-like domain-containing protein [Mycobacteriales bacterium]